MTKSELIDALATSRHMSRRTAEEVVNVVFEGLREALVRGGRIEIRGFGSVKVRQYKGYTGRNPKTGRSIQVKPKRLPVFKPSSHLVELVNKGLAGGEREGGAGSWMDGSRGGGAAGGSSHPRKVR